MSPLNLQSIKISNCKEKNFTLKVKKPEIKINALISGISNAVGLPPNKFLLQIKDVITKKELSEYPIYLKIKKAQSDVLIEVIEKKRMPFVKALKKKNLPEPELSKQIERYLYEVEKVSLDALPIVKKIIYGTYLSFTSTAQNPSKSKN